MLHRLRSLIGALLALVLVIGMAPPPAQAQTLPSLTQDEAIHLLQSYNIVRGDPSGDLGLTNRLTRAEAAALFVRVQGSEGLAKMLVDLVPFTDSKGHWAAGEIALAERMGLMRGDGDGRFRPDSQITYVEVMTVLLRLVQQEPSGTWDPAKIWSAASQLGIAPSGVQSGAAALRGNMFWSLGNAIYRIPLPNGQSVLQRYIDSTPPTLTVDNPTRTTMDRTATITGTAGDAARVLVNGTSVTINASTRRFSHTVELSPGSNSFTVEAFDLAGNRSSAVVSIERRSDATRIEITGPTVVGPNTQTKLNVTAYDRQNRSVPVTDLEVELTGNVATFDLATMTLTTGAATGSGSVTLRSGNTSKRFDFTVSGLSSRAYQLRIHDVNGGRAPTVNKDATVQVQVLDQAGNLVNDDFGRAITLTATGISGVVVTPQTATTQGGVATFTIRGMVEGTTTLIATSSGLIQGATPVQILSSTRVVLTANPTSLRPDGTSTSTIRAVLQDDTGKAVNNTTGANLSVVLTASGTDGHLSAHTVVIAPNASSSNTVTYKAGVVAGTAQISGTVYGNRTYPVQTLSLPVTGALPGAKLQVTYPTTRFTPGGQPASITVRVVDDRNRVISTGSYAFQFTVTTSNNEPLVNGLPEGVQLTFANSNYSPVSDGRADGDPQKNTYSVVGRTHQGSATLHLRYDKSGTVTLTPRLIGPVSNGYHPTGGLSPAASSLHMTTDTGSVTFAANPARIELTADSVMGRDLPGGAGGLNSSMIIRARVVDASGTVIPGYSENITLTRNSGGNGATSIIGTNRKPAVNGVAEFSVQASNKAGWDTYTASVGTLTGPPITISVRTARAETPTIAAIRGVKTGDPSPTTGYVAPDADYMEIQLHSQVPKLQGEPNNWVSISVYRKGEYYPILSGAAVNLRSDLPVVRIPKGQLQAGTHTYEVIVNNGAGDTARSPDLGLSTATNAVYNTGLQLHSAFYDAASNKLTLSTSGLANNGTVAKERLRIVKGNHSLSLAGSDVTVESVSYNTVVLNLGGLQVDPDKFHGTVQIVAQDGWYQSPDGSGMARGTTTAYIQPMPVITHATLSLSSRRLTLHGEGFTHGNLALELIQVGGVPLSASQDRVSSVTEGVVTIDLSQQTLNAIREQASGAHITAGVGWLRRMVGSAVHNAAATTGTNHPVYIQVSVTSVQYDRTANTLTLRGSGFTGGELAPNKLTFQAPGAGGSAWRPNRTTKYTVVDDTTLRVEFRNEDATAFETNFNGRNVFLNTEDGWLVDAQGRTAAPLPTNSVLFSVPVR